VGNHPAPVTNKHNWLVKETDKLGGCASRGHSTGHQRAPRFRFLSTSPRMWQFATGHHPQETVTSALALSAAPQTGDMTVITATGRGHRIRQRLSFYIRRRRHHTLGPAAFATAARIGRGDGLFPSPLR